MAAYVGIDLAWSTKARTGVAVVDAMGALRASGWVRTDTDIDAWLDEHVGAVGDVDGDIDVVAIDAPLIVTNATGQRDCEKLITGAYGRYQAGCHSSNMGMTYMNRPGQVSWPAVTGGRPIRRTPVPRRCALRCTRTRRWSGCSNSAGR